MRLSEILHVNNFEINVKDHVGEIEINAFNVLWCLYWDHVTLWDEGKLGFWIKNYVQSITDLVFGKCLKHLGRLVVICSRVGQDIKKFNSRYRKFIQVVKILLTTDECTPNISPSTSTSKPLLILVKVSTNSSLMESFRFGPTLRFFKKDAININKLNQLTNRWNKLNTYGFRFCCVLSSTVV